MPPHIGEIISAAVYDGQLCSNPEHGVSGLASFFVDVDGGKEKQQGTSWLVGTNHFSAQINIHAASRITWNVMLC